MINENKIYSTPFPLSIIYRGFGLILFYSLFIFLLVIVGGSLYSIIRGNYDFNLEIIFLTLGLLIMVAVFLPSLINQHPIIKVDGTGLYIKIFFFVYTWYFIPWKEIKEIYCYEGLLKYPIWVVRVNKLFFWFRIMSQQYRQGFHPSILIHSHITDYEELVKIIEEKINRN
jgi:hypothetical protein